MDQERDQDLCCAVTQVHTDAVEHVRAQLPRDETCTIWQSSLRSLGTAPG